MKQLFWGLYYELLSSAHNASFFRTIAASNGFWFSVRDEKVGNFPVRMLVILVKLAKLIEIKRAMVRQLAELNTEAEKMNLLSDSYPYAFQVCTF